jgi:hypothetical protein
MLDAFGRDSIVHTVSQEGSVKVLVRNSTSEQSFRVEAPSADKCRFGMFKGDQCAGIMVLDNLSGTVGMQLQSTDLATNAQLDASVSRSGRVGIALESGSAGKERVTVDLDCDVDRGSSMRAYAGEHSGVVIEATRKGRTGVMIGSGGVPRSVMVVEKGGGSTMQLLHPNGSTAVALTCAGGSQAVTVKSEDEARFITCGVMGDGTVGVSLSGPEGNRKITVAGDK